MAVASAVSTILVSRILGAGGAGRVAYAVWLASTVAQVALFALPQVALRFLASPEERPGLARWLTRRLALLAAPAGLAALGLAAASREALPVVAATCLLSVIAMAGTLGQSMLLGNQEYRRLTVLSIVASVLQVAATTAGCRVAGPLGGILASAAGQLPLLLGLRPAKPERSELAQGMRRRVTTFALHSWIASTVSLVAWSRLEFVFLRGFGSEAIGQYAVALAVAQLGLQPATLVSNALLPHFGELAGGAHTETSRDTYAAVTRVSALLALPLCLGLAAVAPALVPALFGQAFAAAILPATLLVAATSIVAVAPAANAMTYAYERTRFISTATLLSSTVAAVAFWGVVPGTGTMGAAWVRALIQGAGVAIGFWYLHHVMEAPFPLRRVLRAGVAALLAAGAGRVVVTHVASPWPALAAGVTTVAVAYALIIPRVAAIERSDVAHLGRIAERLPRPLARWARRYLTALAS